jgi:hypothetical protein
VVITPEIQLNKLIIQKYYELRTWGAILGDGTIISEAQKFLGSCRMDWHVTILSISRPIK